jgi:hypothetical protein
MNIRLLNPSPTWLEFTLQHITCFAFDYDDDLHNCELSQVEYANRTIVYLRKSYHMRRDVFWHLYIAA